MWLKQTGRQTFLVLMVNMNEIPLSVLLVILFYDNEYIIYIWQQSKCNMKQYNMWTDKNESQPCHL